MIGEFTSEHSSSRKEIQAMTLKPRLLAIHVSSVFLPEKPLGGPASLLGELIFLPAIGRRVFVLRVRLADRGLGWVQRSVGGGAQPGRRGLVWACSLSVQPGLLGSVVLCFWKSVHVK